MPQYFKFNPWIIHLGLLVMMLLVRRIPLLMRIKSKFLGWELTISSSPKVQNDLHLTFFEPEKNLHLFNSFQN